MTRKSICAIMILSILRSSEKWFLNQKYFEEKECGNMKYCPYCGASIPDGAVSFCGECGEKLPQSPNKRIRKNDRKGGLPKDSKTPILTPEDNHDLSESNEAVNPEQENSDPNDFGYDGYYDDIVPSDTDRTREGFNKELIKKIILVCIGVACIIGISIAAIYFL